MHQPQFKGELKAWLKPYLREKLELEDPAEGVNNILSKLANARATDHSLKNDLYALGKSSDSKFALEGRMLSLD